MLTKRERFVSWLGGLGIDRLLASLPQRDCLLILNYHRVGEPDLTAYDPGTFSASVPEFEEQIRILRSRAHIATLEEALALVEAGRSWKGPVALLTFDDGYIDNYELAFPILRALGVQATFFLPTGFVGTCRVPWWDRIAYLVRHTRKPVLELAYPRGVRLEPGRGRLAALERALRIYKSPELADPGRFLEEIENAADVPAGCESRLFMNWEEAREMSAAGMAFGSHTHTHQLLSRLSPEEQYQELCRSRSLLEANLHVPIDTLAFPVGSRTAFSPQTFQALVRARYRAAFSFFGGLNVPGRIDPFNLRRVGVDAGLPASLFRMRTVLASALAADIA